MSFSHPCHVPLHYQSSCFPVVLDMDSWQSPMGPQLQPKMKNSTITLMSKRSTWSGALHHYQRHCGQGREAEARAPCLAQFAGFAFLLALAATRGVASSLGDSMVPGRNRLEPDFCSNCQSQASQAATTTRHLKSKEGLFLEPVLLDRRHSHLKQGEPLSCSRGSDGHAAH